MGLFGKAAETGLVADIGGTNARFAWVDLSDGALSCRDAIDLQCKDYPGPIEAVADYLKRAGVKRRPSYAVMAVAGPVTDGAIRFTNNSWKVSEAELVASGFKGARLINDYAALAVAAAYLKDGDVVHLGGPAKGDPNGSVAVCGAGTGFGVSALARDGVTQTPMATEGGHVGFCPTDEVEMEVLRNLQAKYGRVSVERVLSGPGILDLHAALNSIENAGDVLDPAAITKAALDGDALSLRTLERFCAIYGCVAGDAALTFGATGGVYLAGGIGPKILPILRRGVFRERFEAKGRFVEYMRRIPTFLITRDHVALSGAARTLLTLTGREKAHA